MPKLLGVNFPKVIGKAFKGKLRPATLTKITQGAVDPMNYAAGPAQTETSFAAQGIESAYDESQIDGTIIQRNDRRVTLIADLIDSGAVPEVNDRITIEGKTYNVEAVSSDPARATYTCQCRGA